jgi:hypothetical protein
MTKARSSEGAKESVRIDGHKNLPHDSRTICNEAQSLKLLQSWSRINIEYPGFRKAFTLG